MTVDEARQHRKTGRSTTSASPGSRSEPISATRPSRIRIGRAAHRGGLDRVPDPIGTQQDAAMG